MKITLINGDDVRKVTPDERGAATAAGACPHCGAEPFAIGGCGIRTSEDDRAHEADGKCMACGEGVGLIRAEANTLFGLTEDRAVLHGRPRVY